MPLPLIAGAAIAAGASVAGAGINSASTSMQNARSMNFSREMYERQRADNIAFWNMQNEYNSPQAQMARFQAAGLNPHLIYGQGNAGNATPVQTPDVQTPQWRSPEWGNAISSGGLAFVNAMYDLDIKQAQVDNLKAQNGVILQEQLLKAAQTTGTNINADKTLFGLDFEKELRDVSADARREQLRQLKTTTDLSINKDAREAATTASSLKEAIERMATMRQQRAHSRTDVERMRENIRQMEKDGTLKDLEIELRKQGINPQDPVWTRVVGRILSNMFDENGRLRNTGSGGIWQYFFGN